MVESTGDSIALTLGRLIAAVREHAIVGLDASGDVVAWSPGAERLFGYTTDEILTRSSDVLWAADERAAGRTLRLDDAPVDGWYARKDGTRVRASGTVEAVRDAEGAVTGYALVLRPEKESEIPLHSRPGETPPVIGGVSLPRADAPPELPVHVYEAALSNTPDLVYVFDLEGHFIYANDALLTMWGKPWNEAIGRRCIELGYEPWHAEMHEREILEVAATRLPLRGEVPFTGTYGRRVYEYILVPVFDATGRVEAVAGTTRDVTEHKAAQAERERLLALEQTSRAEAEAARARLHDLFMQAPAAICILRGPTHVFELANPRYVSLVNRSSVDDLVGKGVVDALPEVVEQGFVELLDRVYRSGEPYVGREVAVMLRRPDGALDEVLINFVYQPSRDAEGNVDGILVHAVDVGDLVRARRRVEESSRLKDDFLATVSHELRTPLNAILGWARILTSNAAGPELQERGLETIRRNAASQAQLVEDLLDISRIVSGKMRLDVRPVDLLNVITAAVSSLQPAADAKEINVQLMLDPRASRVLGDAERLQQVIWNLLSNAVKFTPKGGRVTVNLMRVNSHVELVVNDNGRGIDPEFLPFVFDRFRQADGNSTRTLGGLGLGLSIVRHLVELHGGSVNVASAGLGHGATFTVSLLQSPVALTDGADRAHPSSSDAGTTAPEFAGIADLSGLAVLVVDDEPDARDLLRYVLEACGAGVATAANADEALTFVKSDPPPDLLISDIGMPVTDGYALISRIRELPEAAGGKIPAIALTAYARVEDRLRVLEVGFQMHVPKPVEPAELVALVASLAGRPVRGRQ